MRKLLLASAAMLGGTMALASVASAQLVTTYSGVTATSPQYGVAPAAIAPLSSPGTGTAVPSYGPPLAPGNVTVRLIGRMYAYAGFVSDSGRQGSHVTLSGNGGVPSATNTKLAPFGMFEFSRLYPSFDAVAANGVKYGAFLEIRQDTGAAAGGGVGPSVSGSVQTRGNLYFRRETSYIGTDQLGFLRFGATDQPTSLMLTGNFENFDDGGWNGDPNLITGNAQVVWPFEDVGNLYTATKIVYMSPQFANLIDFGVSYAPGTGAMGSGPGCNYNTTSGVTGSGSTAIGSNAIACDASSATSVYGDTGRRRNTFDGVVRLRTAFGPVGVAFTAGGMVSGKVNYDGSAPLTGTSTIYNGLAVFDSGLQITYGGLAVGGHIMYGADNGQWSLQPRGGHDMFAALVGSSYTMGSNVIGFQVLHTEDAGSWSQNNTTGTGANVGEVRNQFGVAVGDTFTLAPGAFLFIDYLYGTRHQAGVDLLSGTISGGSNGYVKTNNNTRAQAFFVGTMFRW